MIFSTTISTIVETFQQVFFSLYFPVLSFFPLVSIPKTQTVYELKEKEREERLYFAVIQVSPYFHGRYRTYQRFEQASLFFAIL